ncbi:ATP dependent DNA ligase-like protein [Rhizobium azibense]|nr:ATP dependent DNA ligase-like protein [Rhizobium azibense]
MAPMMSSRRKSRCPIFDVFPRRSLPPDEFCFGVSPIHAAKSRPLEKVSADGAKASIAADGRRLFLAACEHGLEGIIAKDRESPYRSGRLGDWLKIKCVQSDGFAIVGYEHSFVARAGIASLLLGARQGRKLVYVGSVGTGFSERTAHKLREALDKLKVKKPPVEYSGRPKYIVWVKPKLVAEVEYRASTHDGKLRHSSHKGLREPEENAGIYEIE